jgi:putative copper resistance protein D
MPSYVVTWIHLLAAITFIGGWMFIQLVVRPSVTEGKAKPPSTEAIEMGKKIGQRFKTVGWVSLMVLIFTGASQLLDESGSARIETSWGLIMMLKLFVFAIVGGLIFVHDLILDPYGVPVKGKKEEAQPLMFSGKVVWVQRTILGLSLAVLFIAVYLSSL